MADIGLGLGAQPLARPLMAGPAVLVLPDARVQPFDRREDGLADDQFLNLFAVQRRGGAAWLWVVIDRLPALFRLFGGGGRPRLFLGPPKPGGAPLFPR